MTRRERDRQRELQRLREDNARLEKQLIEKQQENWKLHDQVRQQERRIVELEAADAQNLVLQSDRDRLTATVESLARRLASPTAERDASRAGWRAANRTMQATPANEKAIG